MSPFLGIKLGKSKDRERSMPAGGASPAPGGSALGRPGRSASLVELCSDLLSLAYSLRTTDDLGDPAELRRKILQLLERIEGDARKAGYTSSHVDGARFALVALIDEGILSSRWQGRTSWIANPLQKELFKLNVAGEKFYTDLDLLRQNREENRPVLEVFYACLVMGFEGRFKLLGRDKLEALIKALASDLMHGSEWKMENLSPDWRRPDDFPEAVGEGVPVWVTAMGVVGVVLIMLLIFGAIAGLDSREAARTIQEGLARSATR
jgi:type VI secretion system protein ImpK